MPMTEREWKPGPDDRIISAFFNVVEMPELQSDEDSKQLFLMPWGKTVPVDAAIRVLFGEAGEFILDDVAADMIASNFEARDIDFNVNLDHQWPDGRAVGWITDVSATEETGLAVSVEWTPEGKELIESKAYRYASAEISVDRASGRVVSVIGAALTNNPAIRQGMRPVELSTLSAVPKPTQHNTAREGQKGDSDMDLKAWFAQLTGRKLETDGDAVVAASELHQQAEKASALEAQLTTVNAELAAMTERAEKAEKAAAEQAKASHEANVAAALSVGKLAPSQKEWAENQTPDALEAFLATVKEGTFSPPQGAHFDEDDTSDPKVQLSKGADKQARADAIAKYAKENEVSFTEASIILGRKETK